jgi:hypothetical protein
MLSRFTYQRVFELKVFVSGCHEMHLQGYGVVRHCGSQDLLGYAPATSTLIGQYIWKHMVVNFTILILFNFGAAQFW